MSKWIYVFALCFFAFAAKADDVTFLSNLDDIPLMNGLIEAEGGMNFDTPAGRIVESYAVGPLKNQSIIQFYTDSLPSLGWQQLSKMSFEREGEVLTLSIEREENSAVVRFALSPKS